MTGFKTISMFLLGLLVLSCLSTKQEALVDTATALAMQEELTETAEVVVWLRNAEGRLRRAATALPSSPHSRSRTLL